MTCRLDAIIYKLKGRHPGYVSEHGPVKARDTDLFRSLSMLSEKVRADVEAGVYIPDSQCHLRSYFTQVDTILELRDGLKHRDFMCRVDEKQDIHGKPVFEAMCPTNYLSVCACSLQDVIEAMGEVIESRYKKESIKDLLREEPKRPMVTTISLGEAIRNQRWTPVTIRHIDDRFKASLRSGLSSHARTPEHALADLEEKTKEANIEDEASGREQVYGMVDSKLTLKESKFTRHFIISLCRHEDETGIFYDVYNPHTDTGIRSKSMEGALTLIKESIGQKLYDKDRYQVERILSERPILTTIRI